MRVDVRVLLDVDQQMLCSQLLEDKLRRRRIGRVLAGELAEAVKKRSILTQRREADDPQLLTENVIDVTAARSDMHDAGSLTGHDHRVPFEVATAIDHAMTLHSTEIFDARIKRHATGFVLRGEIIKRAGVFPADHLCALDRPFDLVATLLFEDLPNALELWHTARPRPFRSAEAFFELFRKPREFQVVLGEVINAVVALAAQLDVIEVRIDGGGDVAGQRPRGCGPDQKIFVGSLMGRIGRMGLMGRMRVR